MTPVRNLCCCCCGAACRGRQHWNRDKGFGICAGCVDVIKRENRETPEEMRRNYGTEGINYNVIEEVKP